jgi:hypothetical protein
MIIRAGEKWSDGDGGRSVAGMDEVRGRIVQNGIHGSNAGRHSRRKSLLQKTVREVVTEAEEDRMAVIPC